jgi:hypothetical protein
MPDDDLTTRLARWAPAFVRFVLKPALKAVVLAFLIAFTVLLVWAFDARSMPDFRVWHTASLDAEFRARDGRSDLSLADYR